MPNPGNWLIKHVCYVMSLYSHFLWFSQAVSPTQLYSDLLLKWSKLVNVPADELTVELSLISHRSANQSSPTKQDSILIQNPREGLVCYQVKPDSAASQHIPLFRRLLFFYSYSSWTVGTFPVATLLQRGGAVYLIKQVESCQLYLESLLILGRQGLQETALKK